MFERIPHTHEGIEDQDHSLEYEAHAEKHARIMYGPFLGDLKRLNPEGRCLEVGAGPAVMTCHFALDNPGVKVTAIDISRAMADRGRDRIGRNGLAGRVDYQVVDVGNPDQVRNLGSFDLVYTIMSMHHWADVRAGLANLLTVVKEGGRLYVGDLARVWWLYWVPSSSGLFTSLRAAYTKREITAILRTMNLPRITVRRLPPYFYQSITVST